MKRAARALIVTLLGAALAPAYADGTFLESVKRDDTGAALRSLATGAAAASAEPNGTTALHWAVHNGNRVLVRELVDAGADVSTVNDFGATPMAAAAVLADAEILELLLRAGADVESPNADGQTALMLVARTSRVDAAELLLEHGADVNAREGWRGQTALMWAAAQRQPAMMRLLIENGANVDARSTLNRWERQVSAEPRAQWRPPGGWTALLYAARHGCVECVGVLAEAGADLDLANEEGMTALLVAIMNMHFDTAKALIEAGANVDKWDWRGRSPIYAAVDVNTLPRGGRPDRPSTDQTTSLGIIHALLEAGANPNLQLKLNPMWRSIQDDRGKDLLLSIGATPLLRAAMAFDIPAIELLLEHGAHPNLENDGAISTTQIGGITPLMAAAGLGSRPSDTRVRFDLPDAEQRSIAALGVLMDAGGDLLARDDDGRTALHGAASMGWTEVVAFLLDQGADPLAEDGSGMTPLDAAMGRMNNGGLGQDPRAFPDTARFLEQQMARRSARRAAQD